MTTRSIYWGAVVVAAAVIVVVGIPSWAALAIGLGLAVISGMTPSSVIKDISSRLLQCGIIALGAGMNLAAVWSVGVDGALLTAVSLATALVLGVALGRWLRIAGDTPLLISVGTAICGGSAIAAVTSVLHPKEHETSVSLAVVFVLNAIALGLFPLLGHALGLSETVFGRWAALGIHDTSSVVGAGLAYGPEALAVATTTKLARALWIVPVTLVIAAVYHRGRAPGRPSDHPGDRGGVLQARWPWFILGFVVVAAAFTLVPALSPIAPAIVLVGQRMLLLALFLIGLGLSRSALAQVGIRPLLLGVVLWILVGIVSLELATLG